MKLTDRSSPEFKAMRYWDRLAFLPVRQDSKGNVIFYPFGAYGVPRIIESEEQRREFGLFFRKCTLVTLCFLFASLLIGNTYALSIFSTAAAIGATAIMAIPMAVVMKYRMRHLQKSSDRVSVLDLYKEDAAKLSWRQCVVWLIVFALIFINGINMYATETDDEMQFVGGASVLVCGFLMLRLLFLIAVKMRFLKNA